MSDFRRFWSVSDVLSIQISIYLFSKYLLNACHVPSTVLEAKELKMKKHSWN